MVSTFTNQDLTQECESRIIIDATLWGSREESAGWSMSKVIPRTELITVYSIRKPAGLCVNTQMEENS
jgi:hypothetical protein